MSIHIILQRYAAGQATPFACESTLTFLRQYGEIGRGLADQELCFFDPELASSAILVGDVDRGFDCILIEEPKPGPALQAFLFAAIEALDAVAFDGEVRAIYLHHGSQAELPAALVAASASGVHRVVAPAQIWPQDLARPAPAGLRYAALLDNPNPQGRPYQIVDHLQEDARLLRLDVYLHPAACQPGVCRGLRQIMLRIECARRAISEKAGDAWRVELAFQDHEALLLTMETPAPAELACQATFVSAPPGETLDPRRNAFRADFDRVATAEWNAQRCVQQAREEFGLSLTQGIDGARALDQLLQTLHARLANDLRSDFARELVVRWCWFAGSAFGELVRHEVGAQWGTMRLGEALHPVLRTHSGRFVFPLLRVLDALHRGRAVSLADELQLLLAQARSRVHLFNGHDEVAALPDLYQLLIGTKLDPEVPFPLHHQLATAELDRSPLSLLALDRWLLQIRPLQQRLPQVQLTRLVRCVGAYLGEVICATDPAGWLWENYHDYFDGTPGLPDVPDGLQSAVVLRGHGALLFPYSTVLGRLTGDEPRDLLAWACANPTGVAECAERLQQAGQPEGGLRFNVAFGAERAAQLAGLLRETHPELDGELASVAEADRLIDTLRAEVDASIETERRIGVIAYYVGELAIRHRGARWCPTNETRLAKHSRSPMVLETAAGSLVDPFAVALRSWRLGEAYRLQSLLSMINNEAKVLANLRPVTSPTAEAAARAPLPTTPGGRAHAASTSAAGAAGSADFARQQAAEARAAALLANARLAAESGRAAPPKRSVWVLLLFVAPMGGLFAAGLHSTGAGLLVAGLAVGAALLLRHLDR